MKHREYKTVIHKTLTIKAKKRPEFKISRRISIKKFKVNRVF